MSFIPFTEEEKLLANSIDLAQFLQYRGEKLERVGREYKLIYYDSSGKHDSITIGGSRWFDHKNQTGGGAIKFMQMFYNMDFQSAVQELLGRSISPISSSLQKPIQAAKPVEKKEFILPKENSNMYRVYAYLIKQRFISPEIITHFAKSHTLYEDKDYHNVVFVGVDEKGVPRQAHKRSANSFGKTFRITCEGSDTKYSFSHFGKSENLFVFEAPIDMLSYLTLHPQNWQKHSYIAMNGVYENAVLTALKDHGNLNEVILCVDNDEGGIDAVDRLTDILNEKGHKNISRLCPEFKDWNEDLKVKNGLKPLSAVPHRRKDLYHETVSDLNHFPCKPDKLKSRIYAAFKNGQYKYLAEYALAALAFFVSKDNQKEIFRKLQSKLNREYKPYLDKARMAVKQDNLKQAVQAVMSDLNQSARTKEQVLQTAKNLFLLADLAVKCEVEDHINAPVLEKRQEEILGMEEEFFEEICFGYG